MFKTLFSMIELFAKFSFKDLGSGKNPKGRQAQDKIGGYGENLGRGAIGKSNVEAGPGFRGNIWLKINKKLLLL